MEGPKRVLTLGAMHVTHIPEGMHSEQRVSVQGRHVTPSSWIHWVAGHVFIVAQLLGTQTPESKMNPEEQVKQSLMLVQLRQLT